MVLCYADLWFRDLNRQLAILVAAPYDFGLLFGQHTTQGCKLLGFHLSDVSHELCAKIFELFALQWLGEIIGNVFIGPHVVQ